MAEEGGYCQALRVRAMLITEVCEVALCGLLIGVHRKCTVISHLGFERTSLLLKSALSCGAFGSGIIMAVFIFKHVSTATSMDLKSELERTVSGRQSLNLQCDVL